MQFIIGCPIKDNNNWLKYYLILFDPCQRCLFFGYLSFYKSYIIYSLAYGAVCLFFIVFSFSIAAVQSQCTRVA
jgi:hypothetical protein